MRPQATVCASNYGKFQNGQNYTRKKTIEQGLPLKGVDWEGRGQCLGGHVLYLARELGHTDVHTCQNSLNGALKIFLFL